MRGRLERMKYSDAKLLEIIPKQILEADYSNFSLLASVTASQSFKYAMVNDMRLKKAIAMMIKRCDEECVKGTNSHALMLRGFLFEAGIGSTINYAESIRYYEQAIRLGNSNAMYHLAYLYKQGGRDFIDYAQVIILYEQAIRLGHADAMNNRAHMHQYGLGGPVDYAKAIELYNRSIQAGHAPSMYNRAHMHQYGLGGPVDYTQAIALYEQAIALGLAPAMNNRALMYQYGQGGSEDRAKAIVLYERAIRSGSICARANLRSVIISSDLAPALLSLLWDELVKGMSFSISTLFLLSVNCKKTVLEQINQSHLGTSLHFLKRLKMNPQHPLAVIINDGKTDEESVEFKELMNQASLICGARQGFFSEKYSPVLPPEIKNHIFSFIQPGMNYDRKAEQRKNTLNDAALKKAALKQDLAAIKRLMQGASGKKPSEDAVYGALRAVIEKGDLLTVKQLNSYINLNDERIETLCYCARTYNHESIIAWLTYFKSCSVYRELIMPAQTSMDKIRVLLNSYVHSDYRQNYFRYGYWCHLYSEHIAKLVHQIDNKKISVEKVMDILNAFQSQRELPKTDPLAQIIEFLNEIIDVAKVNSSLTYSLG